MVNDSRNYLAEAIAIARGESTLLPQVEHVQALHGRYAATMDELISATYETRAQGLIAIVSAENAAVAELKSEQL